MSKRVAGLVVKLGGSLITDKSRPYTVLRESLRTVARTIAEVYPRVEGLILVHGGGSFGHYEVAKVTAKYGRMGYGESLARVTLAMLKLNQVVVEELVEAGVPAVSMPTHAICFHDCGRGSFVCSLSLLETAVLKKLVPVMYGDAVMGSGACPPVVMSGDELVLFLAKELGPARAVFVLNVDGVYRPLPGGGMGELLLDLTTDEAVSIARSIEEFGMVAEGYDVTGGMANKLLKASECVDKGYCTEAIFVGGLGDELRRALLGEKGTFTVIKRHRLP